MTDNGPALLATHSLPASRLPHRTARFGPRSLRDLHTKTVPLGCRGMLSLQNKQLFSIFRKKNKNTLYLQIDMFSAENRPFTWEIDLSRERNGNGRPKPALFACPQGAQLKDTGGSDPQGALQETSRISFRGRRLDSRHTSASLQASLVTYFEESNISAPQCRLLKPGDQFSTTYELL